MMVPCLLILGFVVFGGGRFTSSGSLWPMLIGLFIVAHIGMMFMGHGDHGASSTGPEADKSKQDSHSH